MRKCELSKEKNKIITKHKGSGTFNLVTHLYSTLTLKIETHNVRVRVVSLDKQTEKLISGVNKCHLLL